MPSKITIKAFERMTKDNAPKAIRDLLEFPYVWISGMRFRAIRW